ncbi:hypothetical protein [Pseudonocardia lacus]|uniref:hypothetical protein n=1 Tax=Pseudonocardia lacus TaxID=2835865 RepID=UPI001BDC4943|nr:hypothetical protein [Pseudonocardia lacus]
MDLYAKVFVLWDGDADSLTRAVAPLVDGHVARRTVTGSVLDLDVEENDDYDARAAASDPDRFLHFPFYLDVEPTTPGADPAEVVAAVTRLLRGLADAGAECVTAADYEDQLPGSGRTGPTTGAAPNP